MRIKESNIETLSDIDLKYCAALLIELDTDTDSEASLAIDVPPMLAESDDITV